MEWLEKIIERDGKVYHVTRSDDGTRKVYKDVRLVGFKTSLGTKSLEVRLPPVGAPDLPSKPE